MCCCSRNYDIKSFRTDLKEVLKKAGVEGKPIMLFLEDYQMLEPAFLEYVNSLLSGGEPCTRGAGADGPW